MLQLKKLGIDDLVHFDFMDPPGELASRIVSIQAFTLHAVTILPHSYLCSPRDPDESLGAVELPGSSQR